MLIERILQKPLRKLKFLALTAELFTGQNGQQRIMRLKLVWTLL